MTWLLAIITDLTSTKTVGIGRAVTKRILKADSTERIVFRETDFKVLAIIAIGAAWTRFGSTVPNVTITGTLGDRMWTYPSALLGVKVAKLGISRTSGTIYRGNRPLEASSQLTSRVFVGDACPPWWWDVLCSSKTAEKHEGEQGLLDNHHGLK